MLYKHYVHFFIWHFIRPNTHTRPRTSFIVPKLPLNLPFKRNMCVRVHFVCEAKNINVKYGVRSLLLFAFKDDGGKEMGLTIKAANGIKSASTVCRRLDWS